MKITVRQKDYAAVRALPAPAHKEPLKPSKPFRWLLKTLSAGDLKETHFTAHVDLPADLTPDVPALILMNHSSFIDLKIAATVFADRPFGIVCTSDGFVGKEWLMRHLGCIPTQKFVTDMNLVRDLVYALKTLKISVLMFPEASYSFDGTATPLPESLGKCLKVLGVPVIHVQTHGAFARDPLYNNLQLRQVDVSADVTQLFSADEVKSLPVPALNARLKEAFAFDNWAWQKENHVKITEPFRADCLHRVLYKCPVCGAEGKTEGKGITLTCHACGSVWELTEDGTLEKCGAAGRDVPESDGRFPAAGPDTRPDGTPFDFTHIPDWYAWERACVREEIAAGTYRMELPVTIRVLRDLTAIYEVGDGVLTHDETGFHLTGCGGALDYHHSPTASYSLYADYFWYELGDMVCIGSGEMLYYCFPKAGENVAAKARLAAEEMYKMKKRR